MPADATSAIEKEDTIETDSAEILELFSELRYKEGTGSLQSPEEWVNKDNFDPSHQLLSDSEIVSEVLGEETVEGSDAEDAATEDSLTVTVTHLEAFEALGTVLEWLEGRGDTDPSHLLLVKNWKDTAGRLRRASQKQTKLTAYFTHM